MSMARKCDVCGKLHHVYNNKLYDTLGKVDSRVYNISVASGFMFIEREPNSNGYIPRSEATYDLCPECFDELLDWIVQKKGAQNEQ